MLGSPSRCFSMHWCARKRSVRHRHVLNGYFILRALLLGSSTQPFLSIWFIHLTFPLPFLSFFLSGLSLLLLWFVFAGLFVALCETRHNTKKKKKVLWLYLFACVFFFCFSSFFCTSSLSRLSQMSDTEKQPVFLDSTKGYEVQGRGTVVSASPLTENSGPGFVAILNSNDSVPAKMKQLAVATKQQINQTFSSLRPWSEFFDRTFFASPAGSGEAISRLNANVRHFSANYIVLSLVCSSYILLINLTFSLCVLAAVCFYMYIRTCAEDLVLRGDTSGQIYVFRKAFSTTQLYVILGVFSILSFWLFNGGSVIFWLALTSVGVTCAHAMMRRPPLRNDDFATI